MSSQHLDGFQKSGKDFGQHSKCFNSNLPVPNFLVLDLSRLELLDCLDPVRTRSSIVAEFSHAEPPCESNKQKHYLYKTPDSSEYRGDPNTVGIRLSDMSGN